MRRLIKKVEKPVRKKIEVNPTTEDKIVQPEIQVPQPLVESEPVVEPIPPAYIEVPESAYIPEYRPLRSVGNSGWQVSDMWRDIRVDDFCG
ncbi:hypothetical protein [Nostoc sp. ChiQUE01b]|uniref:hypothetical protein n=1 Tax=Nostoc sp. ChiQUE01b TaxID=3075376 RepID=UPI002AD2CA16|nr:hypothetical protein [Nostoc sp. ChiQUE01b]MDZ8258913.1 hypothetical protein [Nostoc sp. ChiQUE01b]